MNLLTLILVLITLNQIIFYIMYESDKKRRKEIMSKYKNKKLIKDTLVE